MVDIGSSKHKGQWFLVAERVQEKKFSPLKMVWWAGSALPWLLSCVCLRFSLSPCVLWACAMVEFPSRMWRHCIVWYLLHGPGNPKPLLMWAQWSTAVVVAIPAPRRVKLHCDEGEALKFLPWWYSRQRALLIHLWWQKFTEFTGWCHFEFLIHEMRWW